MNQFRRTTIGAAVSACLSLLACLPVHAAGDKAQVDQHLQAASTAAGGDLKNALSNCKLVGKSLKPSKDQMHDSLRKFIAQGRFEPAQVFDNLYYVGAKWVSSWAIKTSDGIILVDALNNEDEAKSTIEAGLRELGLDPASIKKIIITHAHGDHYGAARYLHEKYGAEILMSETDWQELAKPVLQFDDSLWGRPPDRGTALSDGDKVTLGGYSVTAVQTPGHTPGTLSLVFPVTDHGKKHVAMLWGGNGFNFGEDAQRASNYIKSAKQFRDLAQREHIDVFLSNHAGLDGTEAKLQALKARTESQPNPFVIGVEPVERTMTVLAECGAAVLSSFDAGRVPTN